MPTIGPFIPSKGYSSAYSYLTVPQDMATSMGDCYTYFETVVNRAGINSLNTTLSGSPTILGIGHYIDPAQISVSAATPLVVAVTGTGSAAKKVYTGVLPTGTSPSITLTDRTGAVTLSSTLTFDPWQFDCLNGILIGVGNSVQGDPPIQLTAYTNNVANLSGSPPFASAIKVVNNFCFLGRNLNSSTGYSRVYWSAIGDPQTWPAANFIDVRVNDGDPIVALSSIGQDLLIFKRHSMSRLSTTTTAVSGTVTLAPLTTISDRIGCYGVGCAKNLPDGRCVFLDQFLSLNIFDGSTVTNVGRQPYPYPNVADFGIPSNTAGMASGSTFTTPVSIEVDPYRHCVFVLYGTGTVKTNYSYDYIQNSWSVNNFVGSGITLMAIHAISEGFVAAPTYAGTYMVAGDNNGQLWLLHGTADLNYTTGPNATDGTNVAGNFTMSIKVPDGFVPRTLMVPATLQSGASITATTTYNGSNSQTLTAVTMANAPLWNLFEMKATQTNIPRPMSIQINLSVTAGKTFTIYPFYISDEILSNVS